MIDEPIIIVSPKEYLAIKHYYLCAGTESVHRTHAILTALKDFLELRFAFIGREPQRRYRRIQRAVALHNREVRKLLKRAAALRAEEEK